MSELVPPSLRLRVITPGRLLVEAEVEEVQLPSFEGYLGILPGHRPLVVSLGKGALVYRQGKTEERFFIQGGYAQILPDEIQVFTEQSQDEEGGQVEG